MDEKLRKIVYFDKETIKNILQEKHRGRRTSESIETKETANYGDLTVDGGAKIDIGMPVLARIKFAVSGKMSGKYLIQKDSSTTITSTEISEFEEIRTSFVSFINSRIRDIENSSTFFRVAAGYLKIVGNNVDNVNVKEFKSALESFEGYDVYSISEDTYLRFNNTAFVSNYKRNDLLSTELDIYCVPVGRFYKSDFDFIKQLNRMQDLITTSRTPKTLADVYPNKEADTVEEESLPSAVSSESKIKLYDAVYACISIIQEDDPK